jgi:hypothetical protein
MMRRVTHFAGFTIGTPGNHSDRLIGPGRAEKNGVHYDELRGGDNGRSVV